MPLQRYEKDKILDACFAAFAGHGYENSSTAMLAEASGISKALLFHHFKSKKELYLQVLDRVFEHAREEIGFNIPEDESFFEARERTSAAKFDYYMKNPNVYRIINDAFYSTPSELKVEIEQKYGALMEQRKKIQLKQIGKIPLRPGVSHEQAYKLIMLVLDYFGEKYLRELQGGAEPDEIYLQEFLEERDNFLSMVRYGIERQGE